jgi:cytoskeletal protein CcmA (bactofilin family)
MEEAGMWKKGESEEGGAPAPGAARPAGLDPAEQRASRSPRGSATIGPSITIRGDVTGNEDLVIQGQIEGTVTLKQHNVVVGPEGKVRAGIHGRSVTVEGDVVGDLQGDEQVVLRASANVQGNIQAPRVTLEDGARFRGGIEMGEGPKSEPAPALKPKPKQDVDPIIQVKPDGKDDPKT